MTRLEALKIKSGELYYRKLALKLTESEYDQVVQFIEDNDHLGHLEFEYAINRMFLDMPNKPKNWGVIMELIMACNTAANFRGKS